MNKSAIKKFAVQARNQLIEEIDQKAYEIGVEKDKIHSLENNAQIHGRTLNLTEINQRNKLIEEIKQKGYEQVIDEVAYTWFNRFIALRFMEVNGYLPTGVKVLSSKTEGKIEPDIIQEALNIDLDIEAETVHQYEDNSDTNGLYRYLLIKQCNSLNDIMPFIFEKIADYTEILLPNDLLKEDSVIRNLVENIDNEDWQDVEIIGWIYQFYISEKKDEIFSSKKKIKKDEIPASTQLFTNDWIVKYMVENSLGRYWLESNTNDNLKNKWEYYLEEAEQVPEVKGELEKIRDRNINPEEITFLDPAAGSGHILVYAFEVLYDIYKSAGYMESSIPQIILNKNLYGLEICDRAAQLAFLSVMMKARQKDSRIFEKEIDLNIVSIQESNIINKKAIDLLVDNVEENKYKNYLEKDLKYLVDLFEDAKNYGSIIKIDQDISIDLINKSLNNLKNSVVDLFGGANREIVIELIPQLLEQYKIMKNKYDIVVTNPPYMGNRYMNKKLKKFLKLNYNDCNKDLFSVFIKKCFEYIYDQGYISIITMESWMFLKSFDSLREEIIKNKTVLNLIHMPYEGRGRTSLGINFGTTAFTITNNKVKNYLTKFSYIRYTDIDKEGVPYSFPVKNKRFGNKKVDVFSKIPSFPFAYWLSNNMIEKFEEGISIEDISDYTGSQNKTANNKKYLRYFWEVNSNNVGRNNKWVFYAKGGDFRKHYGNLEYTVNWSKEARNYYKNNSTSNLLDEQYWYKKGITYTMLSSKGTSFRYLPKGCVFDMGGPSINNVSNLYYILALLNSIVIEKYLKVLNPTINLQVKDVKNLPILLNEFKMDYVKELEKDNVNIAKNDWDSFEKSWDFRKHPILTYKNEADTIKEAFNNWSEFAVEQFYQLKENEEKLNEIFIDIYGLEDELDPEVKEKDVTVRKADRARDIRSFMSYAVGCMLGRYSLDEEGLVYAGGEFDHSKYETFKADKDGIIPVLDKEYFDDDIVARFVEFVKVTFGEANLEENLEYIADALIEGGTSSQDTARETIRRYFLFDFIKDHTSEYNKCPIYWLFQSDGRGKAFNALIYMHRYDKGTVSRVRTDYLHELQNKIESEKVRLQNIIDSDLSGRQRTQAKKDLEKLEKQTAELKEYDQKLNHLANQQIEIDLDDGVKENYAKFDEVLKNI